MLMRILLLSVASLVVFASQCMAQTGTVSVMDSRGVQQLLSTPKRVAALNWDIAEQVLALGVTPVAMPDIAGYREWVMQPKVPNSVLDIGSRVEPNFQRLASLNPDVIIIASPQLDLLPRLEQIAPVLFYQTYSEHHDNTQAAIDNFNHLAQLLGKQDQAAQRLAVMKQNIAVMRSQLLEAYQGKLPKVTTFRFASMTSIYQFGDNSTAQYALALLGIEPAIKQAATQWGVKQKRLKTLRYVDDGVALYFEPFAQQSQLKQSVMWNAMPFVRHNKVNSVQPTWNYGGAISIEYMAQALTNSLLEIAPNSMSHQANGPYQ
ncbi:iron-siderophore ABC transporter substrate-binding protein [Shewanella fidelis]|uniref:Iron-siderophore ABC transporter substrate-binding protein n=1 Tax=Shewanella fidelis TaxID=173509 RepID=A0AAW8NUB5_9GAMM|nr:iron-siderophore ABC transporter substrate-binding protein [Shewanella fidelis]MDR8526110.1 iron-siderophore ABC transporter substrate-binding protein [Shewanella fidelis]MDW4813723.1 iron-siderophore ABC transporter substrate-binding protein [Shewanella fidelis]MDW4817819.1 iron-siderophore ABC transporter substrate-binding protein [Shewanella fidelis]MDW4821920.1 iron-siderophore ABC transporter substrate-binding protein [Shewanella fidelis]MDW4826051.1 iron-siderophore ABC transporter su